MTANANPNRSVRGKYLAMFIVLPISLLLLKIVGIYLQISKDR